MKKILVLMAAFLIGTSNLYAGNGDLIVNGSVGIGTTSPVQKLTVNDSGPAYIQVQSTGSGNAAGFVATNGSGRQWNLLVRGDDNKFNIQDIGALATRLTIDTSGNVGIGTTSPGIYKLYVNGTGYIANGPWVPSDSKFKKDVLPIDSALDKVQKLTGVSYLYKTDEYKDKGFPEGKQLGVVAQELEEVIPEAVMTDEEGSKAVNYSEIIPVLIEAIKEQQKEIDDLKSTVTQLQSKAK